MLVSVPRTETRYMTTDAGPFDSNINGRLGAAVFFGSRHLALSYGSRIRGPGRAKRPDGRNPCGPRYRVWSRSLAFALVATYFSPGSIFLSVCLDL